MTENKLDSIDYSILDILQVRGRITNAQLAEEIGLSPASTLERVRKLENQGIITGYHARIEPEKLALSNTLWLQIKLADLSEETIDKFKEIVLPLPEVVSCYQVFGFGEFDFLIKAVIVDARNYPKTLMSKLSRADCIQKTRSCFLTDTFKEAPIPTAHLIRK
ncbi:MAG: Lrp/AsnC family transcriptional regulator [Bacteroidota bacterium]